MKYKSILFFAILFFSYPFCKAQNDTILKLFRTTYVGKERKISLQSNIETIKDIAVKEGNNSYILKKGTYGIADSIGLKVNNLKQVMAVSFVYNYDTSIVHETMYVHELKKYQKLINSTGSEFQYNNAGKSVKITKWYDSKTTFELIEIIDNGKLKVYSVIFDNELNYKKYKGIDFKKNTTSLELLNLLGFS